MPLPSPQRRPRPPASRPPATQPRPSGPVTEADAVSRLLANRDFNCPGCRYPLRGIPGNTCPECGLVITRSRIEFNIAHWRTPAFFVGFAGLFLAFVPPLFATVVILRAAFSNAARLDVPDRLNIFLLFASYLTIARLIVAWVNWSSTMAAWPRWRHWLAALAAWLLIPIGVGIAYLMGTFP